MEKNCIKCTKKFKTIFPNKKFCSDKCRQKFNQSIILMLINTEISEGKFSTNLGICLSNY